MSKMNPAEKGKDQDPAKKPFAQTGDASEYTYTEDANGNIVPGPGVGVLSAPQQSFTAPQQTYEMDEATGELVPTRKKSDVTGTQTPTEQADVATKPANTYLLDWNSTTPTQAWDAGGHSLQDLIADQQRWAYDNGKEFRISDWMGIGGPGTDIGKTKEENEADRKKKTSARTGWIALASLLPNLATLSAWPALVE